MFLFSMEIYFEMPWPSNTQQGAGGRRQGAVGSGQWAGDRRQEMHGGRLWKAKHGE